MKQEPQISSLSFLVGKPTDSKHQVWKKKMVETLHFYVRNKSRIDYILINQKWENRRLRRIF